MKIFNHQIINLPVVTRSGQNIGRISFFEIDVDSQKITKYHVKSSKLAGIIAKELLIDPDQVVSITAQKMTVEDNITSIKVLAKNKSPLTQSPVAPASF